MQDCVYEKIIKLEKQFSSNNYNGSSKSQFTIKEGSVPIMISAPHAVNHYRRGNIKYADMFTGTIAEYIHRVTGCHAIYSSMYTQSDPNYDDLNSNAYQQELIGYVKENNIYTVLDIHGAAAHRGYAIQRGVPHVPNKSTYLDYENVDSIIYRIFEKHFRYSTLVKKEIDRNYEFGTTGQNTVTKCLSENTNAICIQLEINRVFRNPDNKLAFTCMLSALEELIPMILKYKEYGMHLYDSLEVCL